MNLGGSNARVRKSVGLFPWAVSDFTRRLLVSIRVVLESQISSG